MTGFTIGVVITVDGNDAVLVRSSVVDLAIIMLVRCGSIGPEPVNPVCVSISIVVSLLKSLVVPKVFVVSL